MHSLSLSCVFQVLRAGAYQLLWVVTTAFLLGLRRKLKRSFEMPSIKIHETGSQTLLSGEAQSNVIDDNVMKCNPLGLTSQAGGLTPVQ